ncbi:condensation domain-containing protein [Streptomyces sp. 900105245]
MIQLPAEAAEIDPGHAHTWHLAFPAAAAEPGPRRSTSYNQAVHLAAAWSAHTANQPVTTFAIACSFDLPGRLDLPALEAALLRLAQRHEVLRTSCRPTAWGVSVHGCAPTQAHLEHVEAGPLTSRAATRAHLHQLLRQVNPITGPLVVMGAVVRKHSATVHVVYDHLVADVLSAPITVADLTRAYDDLTHHRRPDLTPAASYLDPHGPEERLLHDGAVSSAPSGEFVQDPAPAEWLVLAAQPVGPHGARVLLGVTGVQTLGDVGETGREGFGLLHLVMEDERTPETFLRGRLHQGGLQGGEPGPTHLIRAAFHAQQLGGLEVGVGDVQTHHLVGGANPPVDRLGQGEGVAPGAKGTLRIVLHRRHQLTRHARRSLRVVVQLPQPRGGGHVQPAQGGDAGVVVDDRPRLADPPGRPVRLVRFTD